MPSRGCSQHSHSYGLKFICPPVLSIGMKKKRAEQVLQTTFSLIWFEIYLPTCVINRNEKKTCRAGVADNGLIHMVQTSKCPTVISIGMKKKRAEQVLQTTVSLIWFKLYMSNCNINRNEKKMCRAGVTDNTLIDIVWTTNAHL